MFCRLLQRLLLPLPVRHACYLHRHRCPTTPPLAAARLLPLYPAPTDLPAWGYLQFTPALHYLLKAHWLHGKAAGRKWRRRFFPTRHCLRTASRTRVFCCYTDSLWSPCDWLLLVHATLLPAPSSMRIGAWLRNGCFRRGSAALLSAFLETQVGRPSLTYCGTFILAVVLFFACFPTRPNTIARRCLLVFTVTDYCCIISTRWFVAWLTLLGATP